MLSAVSLLAEINNLDTKVVCVCEPNNFARRWMCDSFENEHSNLMTCAR